jgi:hypothetical protein
VHNSSFEHCATFSRSSQSYSAYKRIDNDGSNASRPQSALSVLKNAGFRVGKESPPPRHEGLER